MNALRDATALLTYGRKRVTVDQRDAPVVIRQHSRREESGHASANYDSVVTLLLTHNDWG